MVVSELAGERSGITVSLPTVMQSATNGCGLVELDAGTVEQAINLLVRQFPELSPRLLTEQRQIHRFVNVYLGDNDIRFLNGLKTLVAPGQHLTVLSAFAGG